MNQMCCFQRLGKFNITDNKLGRISSQNNVYRDMQGVAVIWEMIGSGVGVCKLQTAVMYKNKKTAKYPFILMGISVSRLHKCYSVVKLLQVSWAYTAMIRIVYLCLI